MKLTIKDLISGNSNEEDAVLLTDESVQMGVKSGWAVTVTVYGTIEAETSGAVDITTSIMRVEVKAITEALRYLKENQHSRAVIVTDSKNPLQKKVQK